MVSRGEEKEVEEGREKERQKGGDEGGGQRRYEGGGGIEEGKVKEMNEEQREMKGG